ncbi:MAG: efflux RND transporter periplasmic adaptor subunit [Gammaproteobacteria bacterium]|nr:efflux RND transporter periplasmic adaptor subunit [Gammaproteobacteria bacterium]
MSAITHAHLLLSCLTILAINLSCSEIGQEGGKPSKKTRAPSPHLVATEVLAYREAGLSHARSGTLKARQSVRIFNQEEGRITELPLYEGDRVTAGQRLVRLEDDRLRAELEKARATREQAHSDLQRLTGLTKRKAISDDELARANTALDVAQAEEKLLQIRLGYTQIEAPFDGLISQRLVEPGDVVPRHTHLLSLIDPASLITEILVSDLLLPRLSLGDTASVRIDGLSGEPFPGRILRIHPELDAKTRMGTVEILLDPVPPGARPGQLARVTLNTASMQRLMVPFQALQRDRDGEYVYRLDENNRVHRAPVNSGLRIADRIEIIDGLSTGQRLVVKGFLGLREGTQVEPVE